MIFSKSLYDGTKIFTETNTGTDTNIQIFTETETGTGTNIKFCTILAMVPPLIQLPL